MGVLSFVSKIIPAFDSAVNAGSAGLNYFSQMQNLDWMKNAQKTTWAREDNSIQRRVADLKAAGLSPVLAAGQGAASSAPVKLEAPQIQKIEPVRTALDVMQQKANIAQTAAQTEKLRQDALGQDLANSFAVGMNPLSLSLKQLQDTEEHLRAPHITSKVAQEAAREKLGFQRDYTDLERAEHDLRKYKQWDLPSNAMPNNFIRGATVLKSALGHFDEYIRRQYE